MSDNNILEPKKATDEETEYIQYVYDHLNEKCALDYAESLGINVWSHCTFCAGKTPTNENEECVFCHEKRNTYKNNE